MAYIISWTSAATPFFPHRVNGEPMTTVAIGIAEVNIARRAANGQAIIAVEDDVVFE